MKNKIKNFVIVVILTLVPILSALAQPPAPDPSTSPVDGTTPVMNCTAPIGDGFWILLVLVMCYGAYQGWQMRKAKLA
jgi:hypothetical protein